MAKPREVLTLIEGVCWFGLFSTFDDNERRNWIDWLLSFGLSSLSESE